MKKKRILLIDLGGSMGGVESYLENLADMLSERAELFSLCALPELAKRLRNKGARVFLLPALLARHKGLRFLAAAFILPTILVGRRIAAVQVNGFLEAVLLLPARMLGREAIYTRHGPFEDDLYKWYRNPARFIPRYLSRTCVHLATRVICVSEAVETVVKHIIPAERITVIPNWVSRIPNYKPREERLKVPARLLYVGRLERYKGLYLLLEALRKIPNAALTVLGDGSYRTQLEDLAAGLNVEFEGFQQNPEPYYAQADIFVMPSMGPEGLPMVTIEAMAQGLPCLFSDLSVHREITAQGRAGMLFRSGDAEDLRAKLTVLLEEGSLRTTYSKEAYRMVREKYNPDTARQLYLRVFGLSS
jgi:glycosyltransferase involved in cell wall biosynthesis